MSVVNPPKFEALKRTKHKNGKVHNLGPLPLSRERLRAAAVRRGVYQMGHTGAHAIRTVIVHRITLLLKHSCTITTGAGRKRITCQDVDMAHRVVCDNGRVRSATWLQWMRNKPTPLAALKARARDGEDDVGKK
jgi:histone H3/H4